MFRFILFIPILFLMTLPAALGIDIDQTVPDFKAADPQGKIHTLDEYSGKATIVLFWRPEAERARNSVCEVDDAIHPSYEGARLVTIVSGEHDLAEIQTVLDHCGRKIPVLLDLDRRIFADYNIIALPTLMVLSPQRKLEYKEAGFSHEGITNLTAELDAIYGRKQPTVSMPEGSPEAIRRLGLATQFLKKGLTERAEDLLTQLIQDHPEYRPAWVSLGYCRIELGKVEASRECFEEARSLDAKNPDVAAGLAWIWWKKGCPEEAAKWASLVGDNDPNGRLVNEIQLGSLK